METRWTFLGYVAVLFGLVLLTWGVDERAEKAEKADKTDAAT